MTLRQVAGTTFSSENDKVKKKRLHRHEELEEEMGMWEEGQASEGQCHTSVNGNLSSHITHLVLAVKTSDLKVGTIIIQSREGFHFFKKDGAYV